MKTIIVVFGNNPNPSCNKQYCFRTEADLNIGDKLRSSDYDTDITVTDVVEEDYTYYNQVTGEMSNKRTSTLQWPIKTIEVGEKKDNVVFATVIK